ncbi:MAG TPA: hypothetical protein VF678_03580 [bacterium]
MKRIRLMAAGALVGLVGCAAAQPVPVSDADLNAKLGAGAQAEFMAGGQKGVMTFFADRTVSREMGNSGQIDDGTWRVADGKLCITWKTPAAPEACMTQMKVGSSYEARGADGSVAMAYTLK